MSTKTSDTKSDVRDPLHSTIIPDLEVMLLTGLHSNLSQLQSPHISGRFQKYPRDWYIPCYSFTNPFRVQFSQPQDVIRISVSSLWGVGWVRSAESDGEDRWVRNYQMAETERTDGWVRFQGDLRLRLRDPAWPTCFLSTRLRRCCWKPDSLSKSVKHEETLSRL